MLCALGFAGLPAWAQTFSPPVNIAGDATAFSPQVIVDSTGNLDFAYLDTGSAVSSNALWFVRGTMSAGAFHPLAPAVQVAASAGSAFSMALESDCTIDFAFANAFGVESNNILFAQSADCGKTFQTAGVTNNPAGSAVGNPLLAVAKGVAEVVWTAQTAVSLNSTIYHAERQASGSFTSPAVLASGKSGVSCLTVFAVPGTSNAAAGWCDIDSGSIFIANAVATGRQPASIGMGQSARFAADPAGNIYAVWDDASNSSVWFSRSSGATGGFSAPKQILPTVTGAQTTVPQMAIDSKGNIDLLVSVEQRTGPADRSKDTFQFSLSRSSDGGNSFSAPASIATESCPLCGSGVTAQMAVDSAGDAEVAWEALGGWSPAGFWFSRSNAQGSSFSAPVSIASTPTGGAGIASDAANHVFLSWTAQGAMLSEGSAPSDFSVSATPLALSAMPGGSATAQVTLVATGGFDEAVSLGCSSLPAGAQCSFDPASATPTASGTVVTVTVTVPPTLPPGGFPFTITATTPFEMQEVNIQEAVGVVAGQVSPAAVTIPVGGTATFTVTMTGTNGLTGQFQLGCSSPADVTCKFTPGSFFLPVNGRMSATLTAQVANVPATGTALPNLRDNFPFSLVLLLLTALGAPFARWRDRGGYAPVARAMAAITMVFALAAVMTSCGGAVGKQTFGSNSTGTTGSSTTPTGSTTTPAGATSVTFPMTVVAQSGGSVVNVGTITITVP